MAKGHGCPATPPGASRRARRATINKVMSVFFSAALALSTPLSGVSAQLAYADAAQGGTFTVVEEGASGDAGSSAGQDAPSGDAPSGGAGAAEETAGGQGAGGAGEEGAAAQPETTAGAATSQGGMSIAEEGAGTAAASAATPSEADTTATAAATQATETPVDSAPTATLCSVEGNMGLEYVGVELSGLSSASTLRVYADGSGVLYPAIAGSAYSQAAGGTYPYAEQAVSGDGTYGFDGVQLQCVKAVALVGADGAETVLLDADGALDALASIPSATSYASQGEVTVGKDGDYSQPTMGYSSMEDTWSYTFKTYSDSSGTWTVQCVSPTASAGYQYDRDTTVWTTDGSVQFMEYVASRGYAAETGAVSLPADDAGHAALMALADQMYVPDGDSAQRAYAAEHLLLAAALQVQVAHGENAFNDCTADQANGAGYIWDAVCSAMAGYNYAWDCTVYVRIAEGMTWDESNNAIARALYALWAEYTASGYDSLMSGITASSWIGFANSSTSYSSGLQHIFGYRVYGAHTTPEKGYLELCKESADHTLTDGNPCYSLKGAVYGIYSDEGCTALVTTLETDEYGYAKSGALDAGTYRVKETEASPGYGVDTTVYTVQVEAGQTSRVGGDGATLKEPPQNDPVVMRVQKVDSQTGEPVAVGDGSLAGAQFTVRYYDGIYDTLDGLPSSAARTWVIQTDANGKAHLEKANLVEGSDDLYTNSRGEVVIPLGTITVQETKAPEGYTAASDDVRLFTIESNDSGAEAVTQDLYAEFSEVSEAGGVSLQKQAAGELPEGTDLSGIVFGVYNSSAASVTVDGVTYEPVTAEQVADGTATPILTLVTDTAGFATTDADGDGVDRTLPYGTYTVHEISVPEGGPVTLSAEDQTVEVRQDGAVAACAEPFTDELARAGLAVQKVDADTGAACPQGAATLAGATFEVRDADGETVLTLETDENGYAATAADALTLGTYTVVEVGAPDGYGLPAADGASQTVTLAVPGEVAQLSQSFADPVERGGLSVQKVDADTGTARAQGGATLEGATFSVYNATGRDVVVGGVTYGSVDASRLADQVASGEAVAIEAAQLVTDSKGHAATAADLLPVGTYLVVESQAPEGYNANAVVWTVEVAAGEVTPAGDGSEGGDVTVADRVVRGDVELVKARESDMARLSDVAFLLTNEDTGESHVVVTDANGCIDTASLDAARETNGNDEAYDEATGEVDESALDARRGVWFGDAEVQDGLGCLPYGTYTLRELSCKSNAGLVLVSVEFHVYRDSVTVDLGTVDDKAAPSLGSELLSAEGAHEAYAGGTQALSDTVEFADLPGGDYRAVLTLVLDDGTQLASAEARFSTVKGYGEYSVTCELDTSELAGRSVVAFEDVYDASGSLVARHEDPSDEGQTVRFLAVPEIGTTLAGEGGEKVVSPSEGTVTLVDAVSYTGLATDGRSYTVTGALYDKATGEAVLDADGNALTASAELVPEAADGTVEVAFEADASLLSGKAVVAFETLTQAGRELAVHADLSDEGQTAWVPEVGTTLTDSASGLHVSDAREAAGLTDTVSYSGLKPGEEYEITGTLHDKATGEELTDADGAALTASARFTPESEDGTATVEFSFDASALAGRTVVAFESVSLGGREVAVHADLADEGQSVRFPGVSTEFATPTGSHVVSGTDPIDLTDAVSLENLEPGRRYNLFLTLYDPETGEELHYSDGSRVEANLEFVADSESCEQAVTLAGLTPEWEGTAVAMEDLYALCDDGATWALVGTHRDASDTAQTVSWGEPLLRTTLASSGTGLHEVGEGESVKLTDTVEYDGLEAGAEHTLTGALRYADTGEAVLDAEGNEVSSTVTFTPEEGAGSVEVEFTVDTTGLGGRALVAFESASVAGREVASHADLSDAAQTVRVVSVRTTATDASDGDHEVEASAAARLSDRVELKGLEAGATYTIETELADASTKETVATSSATVSPSKSDTAYTISCDVDTSQLAGRDLVFLETLKRDGEVVAEHRDYSDVGQTVRVASWIGTTLTDKSTGYHETAPGQVTLVDTVAYHGLTTLNVEYTLTGELRYADGKAVAGADGNPLTATAKFTPTSSDGTATVEFTLDASGMADGTKVVAFETLTDANGRTTAVHQDLSDADQTVTFRAAATSGGTATTTTTSSMPQTGQGLGWAAALALGALAAFVGGFYAATGRLPIPSALRRRGGDASGE